MSVGDHLKSAATELMKAADLLKQEIDQLRKEEIDLREFLNKHTARMNDELRLREKEVHTNDTNRQSLAQTAIRDITTQIALKKQQVQDDQKRIADIVREKEGQIEGILSQARSIMP